LLMENRYESKRMKYKNNGIDFWIVGMVI